MHWDRFKTRPSKKKPAGWKSEESEKNVERGQFQVSIPPSSAPAFPRRGQITAPTLIDQTNYT